jgi:hypothetical protein
MEQEATAGRSCIFLSELRTNSIHPAKQYRDVRKSAQEMHGQNKEMSDHIHKVGGGRVAMEE